MLCKALSRTASVAKLPQRVQRGFTLRCYASAAAPPKHYILEYSYVPDILEKRQPYRADHLAAAKAKADAGKLLLGGAFGEKPDGALFIFKDITNKEIEDFVAADPYIKAGLVVKWAIKPYTVVVP